MGFNKKYLPEKYQLQQMVYDHGAEYVVRIYESADALIGPSNSIEYLHSLQNIIKSNKK
jgi:hypothetical protein